MNSRSHISASPKTFLHPLLLASSRPSPKYSWARLISFCDFIFIPLFQSLLADTSVNAGPHVSGGSALLGQDSPHLSISPLPLLDHAALPAAPPALPAPSNNALEGPGPKHSFVFCCQLAKIPLMFWCYIKEF